ncbi:MAG: glycine cleavage system protein GcvH [Anaerolineaceae bacterium]|nr:glycine cleavage system protein GcvH [Anaerolineaceae bacterium]
MNTPAELKYTTTDEWVKVDGNVATIGVTDYAQEQLSDVVFAEIVVSVGEMVKKSANIATLESVKAAADVTLPVSGKVVSINEELSQNPEIVNTEPYGKAWMIKVDMTDLKDYDAMMDAAGYIKFCEERSH